MYRRSVCVDGSSSLDALREGASAGTVGDVMEMLDVAPLEGGVGWHRSMIVGAAGGVLGWVVGEVGLGLIGVESPLEGVSGWHKSMVVGAVGDDFGGVAGSELGLDGGVGSSLWAMVCGLWSLGGGVACGGCGRLGDAGGLGLGGAGALGAFWNQGRVERP